MDIVIALEELKKLKEKYSGEITDLNKQIYDLKKRRSVLESKVENIDLEQTTLEMKQTHFLPPGERIKKIIEVEAACSYDIGKYYRGGDIEDPLEDVFNGGVLKVLFENGVTITATFIPHYSDGGDEIYLNDYESSVMKTNAKKHDQRAGQGIL